MTAGAPASVPAGSPSAASYAAALLCDGLVAHGVRDVVISPGSRSQALALAALRLSRAGLLRVHVRVDERVAGFFALGLARETGVPVALVCTSGTAAAGYLPATMEAFHAGVPLLLLTADRPPELRGVGANQATTQPGMYAAWARWAIDAPVPTSPDASTTVFDESTTAPDWGRLAMLAVSASMGAVWSEGAAETSIRGFAEVPPTRGLSCVAGPVHVNLPFREPLSGRMPDSVAVAGTVPALSSDAAVTLEFGLRTLVVAGADAGPSAALLAEQAGWPLVAEVVSRSRFGADIVADYRQALRDPQRGGRVQRVVLFGHPTLSREVTALLTEVNVEVVAVRRGGEVVNLNGRTRDAAAVQIVGRDPDQSWREQWLSAPREADDLVDPTTVLTRELLVEAVWRATTPEDRLMIGSSRLVRVLDTHAHPKDITVHANRGLAGIDGTIATAHGIAAAQFGRGMTRVLLGDLSVLHDVGAMLMPPDEPEPRLQVIVGNDGGGTIFDALEVAQTAQTDDLDRAFYTPHRVNMAALADAYGWTYRRARTVAELDDALLADLSGRQLIEVPLPR